MKKVYLTPESESFFVVTEGDLLTTSYPGRSTTDLIIVDSTEEDDWVY